MRKIMHDCAVSCFTGLINHPFCKKQLTLFGKKVAYPPFFVNENAIICVLIYKIEKMRFST